MIELKLSQLFSDLKNASDQDLRSLNSQIVSILNQRSKVRSISAGSAFNVGQTVSFKSKNGDLISGVVERINVKSIKIKTDRGFWNVSPTLVKAA